MGKQTYDPNSITLEKSSAIVRKHIENNAHAWAILQENSEITEMNAVLWIKNKQYSTWYVLKKVIKAIKQIANYGDVPKDKWKIGIPKLLVSETLRYKPSLDADEVRRSVMEDFKQVINKP